MGCCRCCCILMLSLLIIIGLFLGLFAAFFPYPSHASCVVDWNFGKRCDSVESALQNQMKTWSDNAFNLKQQYGYEYIEDDKPNMLFGRRTVALFGFTDGFNFTFDQERYVCSVQGKSSSDAWYAVIDFGFNYCNMKNLIIGTKLNENDPAYEEESSNSICTMYSIAHCNLYGW